MRLDGDQIEDNSIDITALNTALVQTIKDGKLVDFIGTVAVPQAVVMSSFYISGTGIWKPTKDFNATTPPITSADWTLAYLAGDVINSVSLAGTTFTLNTSGGIKTVDLASLGDTISTVTFNQATSVLTISTEKGDKTVDLSVLTTTGDTISTVTLAGTVLTIATDKGNKTVELGSLSGDTISNLTLNGSNVLTITTDKGDKTVDLSSLATTGDTISTVTLDGTYKLTIVTDKGNKVVDLAPIVAANTSDTLTGLSLNSTTNILTVTTDKGSQTVDLTPILANAPVKSVNNKTGVVNLSKVDIGLSNVDNTSDALKPISTAVSTALNLKANDSNTVHTTGDETIAGVKNFTNSIGIGIVTPNAVLHAVKGVSDFRFSEGDSNQTPTISVINTNPGGKAAALGAGTGGSAFTFDNSGGFYIVSDSKANFLSNTLGSGATRMSVFPNGNITIGSGSDLLSKLNVEGTIYSSSGGFKFPDGSIQLSAANASLNSPAFTGNPTAPTQAALDNSTSLATTAYVTNAVAGATGGTVSKTYVDSADTVIQNQLDNDVVKKTGNQSIAGEKYFTNNVGIGTNAPSNRLNVVYDDANYKDGLVIQNTNSGGNALSGIKVTGVDGINGGFIQYLPSTFNYQPLANTVIFASYGKTRLGFVANSASIDQAPQDIYFTTFSGRNPAIYIKPTGAVDNIGIGTDIPTSRLEVSGVVYSSTGGFKFPDSTIQTTAGIPLTQKGVANGVASLDETGKVPSSQLPVSGGAVSSVAGKTGAVTLVKADVGLSNVDNTTDAQKFTSTVFTGTPNLPTGTVGVTQTTFDNSTKLATTAFVKNLDANNMHLNSNDLITGDKTFVNSVTFSGTSNTYVYGMLNADTNSTIRIQGNLWLREEEFNSTTSITNGTGQYKIYTGTGGHTLSLPPISSGSITIWVEHIGTGILTVSVAASSGNTISNNGVNNLTSLTLASGETIKFHQRMSPSIWVATYQGGMKPSLITAANNLKANLASPALTGNPTTTTQATADNSTRIASTAYVKANDALKANLDSPTFTGTVNLPVLTKAWTQPEGTNDTGVATNAFVMTAVSKSEPKLPVGGSTTNWLRGDRTWANIDKWGVGLGNVDNTTDINKPISTATQTALNSKASTGVNTFTGDQTVNGKIGIATSTPQAIVDINAGNVGSNPSIKTNSDVIIGAGASVFFGNYAYGASLIGYRSGSTVLTISNNSNDTSFLANGNVGIGTTVPNSRLEVSGIIHSTSGGIKFPDGTTQTTAASGTAAPADTVGLRFVFGSTGDSCSGTISADEAGLFTTFEGSNITSYILERNGTSNGLPISFAINDTFKITITRTTPNQAAYVKLKP